MNLFFNITGTNIIKIKLFSAISLIIFVWGGATAVPKPLDKQQVVKLNTKFVAGEILVRFKSNMTAQEQQSAAASLGAQSVKKISKSLKISKVQLQLGDAVITAVQAYKNDPNIEYAQPNYIYHATALPNDTSFTQQWGFKNTGQTITSSSYVTNNPGIMGYDIDAESAWNEITDCRSTVVAVLDTGINYTHQDLTANMWDGSGAGYPNHGYDFVDMDNDPMPTGAKEDHGTHVAGTIGAVSNNGSGVSGVCWQANIMSVRVLGEDSFGSTSGIIQGIEFASNNGASVINMSLGGESTFDTLFSNAVSYAQARDVVVVVVAGNGGSDDIADDNDGLGDDANASTKYYPCNFAQNNLLCVAALDQSYSLASFSNYGATSVDIGAPGTNILSSYAGQTITDDFTSGWLTSGSAGWAYSTCSGYTTLSNPANWCSGGTYAINTDSRVFKVFNLNGAIAAELDYFGSVSTEANYDFFSTAMKSIGGDPFTAGGTVLISGSGVLAGLANHNISSCNTATCSLGFRLTSDISVVSTGVGIRSFSIRTLQTNSTNYQKNNGTSMASPHVAGIATMIRAFNPNYTYAQTVAAIKNGGESVAALSGTTTTGRAANAMGALAYISEPTGVAAVVQ